MLSSNRSSLEEREPLLPPAGHDNYDDDSTFRCRNDASVIFCDNVVLKNLCISNLSGRPTNFLMLTTFLSSISDGISFIHLAATNLPSRHVSKFFNQSILDNYGHQITNHQLAILWGLLNGGVFVFAMLSSFTQNIIAERYGRKFGLFCYHNVIMGLANFTCFIAVPLNRPEFLFLGQALMGYSWGIGNLCTMYLSECSPPAHRGKVNVGFTVACLSSASVSYVLTLPSVLGTHDKWHYVFLICFCVVLVISTAAWCLLIESPKHTFIRKNDRFATENALRMLYGSEVNTQEVLDLFEIESKQAVSSKVSYVLKNFHLRKGLIVSVVAAMLRGFSGIVLVELYSVRILERAVSVNSTTAKYLTIAASVPCIIICVICWLIIDRVSRRKMFLGSLGGMIFFFCLFVAFSLIKERAGISGWPTYCALGAFLLASWCYPLGVSPIHFSLAPEVTPQITRSLVLSFATFSANLACFVTSFLLPILSESIGLPMTILVLIIIPCILSWCYLWRRMPETYQLSVAEIVQKWIDEETTL